MERIYEYRVHIKKMKKVIPIILVVTAIAQFVILIGIQIFTGFNAGLIGFSLVLAIILTSEAVFINLFYGRFVKVNCRLTEEGIVYTNIKKTITMPYEEITEIEFPSIKYTGGWVKIKSAKETIRLTVVIESIQDFLRELKNEIDSRDLSIKLKEKNYRSFLRTATYSDHSWQRVYQIWLKILGATLLTTVLAVVIGLIKDGSLKVIFGLLAYLLPLFVYLICEVLIGKKLSKQFKENEALFVEGEISRDQVYEKAVFTKGFRIGSVIFVIMMVINMIV